MRENFLRLYKLIAGPSAAWKKISELPDGRQASQFANMHILLCMAAAFCAESVLSESFTWQTGLGHFILNCVCLYAGLHLAALAVKTVAGRFFSTEIDLQKSLEFCTYGSSFVFISLMAGIMFDSFFIMLMLSVYSFQIVYEGARYYLPKDHDNYNTFVLVSGALMIISPIAIRQIVLFAMPAIK